MNLTINGKELDKSFVFSGGEVQIRLPELPIYDPDYCDGIIIKTRINSSDKLMELMLVADAIDIEYGGKFTLDLSYMPYARQDRVCYKGEAYSLFVAIKMINSMRFDNVLIDDIHSDISRNNYTIENAIFRSQLDILKDNKSFLDGIDVLIAPDRGASQKTKEVGEYFGIPVVQANKRRNPENGYIVYDDIDCGGIDIEGKSVLMLDDICDGGVSFLLLAEKLKKCGVGSMSLYVTHGIFSKGKKVLTNAGIENIYCINDFLDEVYL